MNSLVKWIGGATAIVLAVIGIGLVAGESLPSDGIPSDDSGAEIANWISEGDVLADDAENSENSGLAIDLTPQDAPLAPASGTDAPIQNAAIETAPAADMAFGADPITPTAQRVAFNSNEPFVIKRILPIEGAIKYGEWHWDDAGVPDGPLVVTVDLDARVISVFRNGYEIGAAAALLGTPAHPTPLGTFPILTKERHNVSEKYNNAPMPWTLRLTWGGVAIHGGSDVEVGYASHGCVGVPDEFASRLYDIAKKGDKVIITRGLTAGVGSSIQPG